MSVFEKRLNAEDLVLHPNLQPYKRQMIIPLTEIIESVDVRASDKWVDKDPEIFNTVLQSLIYAFQVWSSNGWTILMEVQNKTPAQARDMVLEYIVSTPYAEMPCNRFAPYIAVALIPMMVSIYEENGYFLDKIGIVDVGNGVPQLIGGDVVVEATYIRTY